jgi:Mycobacterial 4 TMS phage holin, superfamily IV
MRILIHWFITTVALVVAAWLVPGIRVEREAWTVFAAMAIILGLVNAFVRPLLKLLRNTWWASRASGRRPYVCRSPAAHAAIKLSPDDCESVRYH